MHTVTLSAPGKNALSLELMTSVLERFRAAAGQPVLVTGAGDVFCAGLNLKEVATLPPEGLVRFLGVLEEMVSAVFHHEGPVVAIVNGHAIAGGCILAMACDVRIGLASDTTRIGLNEVPLGLRFPPKTWRMVKRRLPGHLVDRVVLEGGLHAPKEAVRLGLLDEVVETPAQALALAERIAASPPGAYAAAKRGLRAGALDVSAHEASAFLAEGVKTWTDPGLRASLLARLKG